jgi:hypothetical protein
MQEYACITSSDAERPVTSVGPDAHAPRSLAHVRDVLAGGRRWRIKAASGFVAVAALVGLFFAAPDCTDAVRAHATGIHGTMTVSSCVSSGSRNWMYRCTGLFFPADDPMTSAPVELTDGPGQAAGRRLPVLLSAPGSGRAWWAANPLWWADPVATILLCCVCLAGSAALLWPRRPARRAVAVPDGRHQPRRRRRTRRNARVSGTW